MNSNRRASKPRPAFLLALGAVLLIAPACSGDGGSEGEPEPEPESEPEDNPSPEPDAPACLDPLELDCSLTFAPTFESIFENRLRPTCGAAGSSCHSDEGAQGDLVLDDIDVAYDSLLGRGGSPDRVLPGDPECSPLMARLESDDPTFVMPVGSPLPEGERCSIRNWIAMGAER